MASNTSLKGLDTFTLAEQKVALRIAKLFQISTYASEMKVSITSWTERGATNNEAGVNAMSVETIFNRIASLDPILADLLRATGGN